MQAARVFFENVWRRADEQAQSLRQSPGELVFDEDVPIAPSRNS